MNLVDKLLKYVLAGVAVLLLALALVQTVRLHITQIDLASLQTQLANEHAQAAVQLAVRTEQVRQSEQALGSAASQTKKDTDDQVRTLSARNADLLARVRRAEAAAATRAVAELPDAAPAAGPGQVAARDAGAELLATLGAADVHEAERADVIRLHLAACYASYERAQAALDALSH